MFDRDSISDEVIDSWRIKLIERKAYEEWAFITSVLIGMYITFFKLPTLYKDRRESVFDF